MDFIRKNWSRLSLALLFFIGGVFGIIAWANSTFLKNLDAFSGFYKFFFIASLIVTLVYFFGMTCVTVLKAVAGKKAVSISYMVIGGIITVLELVVLCVCGSEVEFLNIVEENSSIFAMFLYVVPTIVFGFYPLVKGVTRFIEAEQTPKAAPVKPAVEEPAAEKKAAK